MSNSLYPQTAAEFAANVTPTDCSYMWYDSTSTAPIKKEGAFVVEDIVDYPSTFTPVVFTPGGSIDYDDIYGHMQAIEERLDNLTKAVIQMMDKLDQVIEENKELMT